MMSHSKQRNRYRQCLETLRRLPLLQKKRNLRRILMGFVEKNFSWTTTTTTRPHAHHHHNGTLLTHPCVGKGLAIAWGSATALFLLVVLVSVGCRKWGVRRLRKKTDMTEEAAEEELGHFWHPRLESAGLILITAAAVPILISYSRHFESRNLFWLLSALWDVLGMGFVCAAFIYEDSDLESGLGLIGGLVLLMSDGFSAYSAILIGLTSSSLVGVVLLWFFSSLVSACGCIFLALCYFEFPCGERLRLYFECACLYFFCVAASIELAYGFCPAEDSSPNFFGSAGAFSIAGYMLCLAAVCVNEWPSERLKCRVHFPRKAVLPVSDETDKLLMNEVNEM